jgi:hypothetical protein
LTFNPQRICGFSFISCDKEVTSLNVVNRLIFIKVMAYTFLDEGSELFRCLMNFGICYFSGVRFLVVVEYFSLRHRVQTSNETQPATYPLSTGDSFSGSKVAGA